MNLFRLIAVLAALFATPALSQVRQSGTVTPRHAACWVSTGVIGDCGTAASNSVTSFGTTGQGPTICANSDSTTAAGWQRICFGATTADGGQISVQNFGTATAMPLTFDVNGTVVSLPSSPGSTYVTGNAPFTSGVPTCWSADGVIQNCSAGAVTLLGNPGSTTASPSFFTISGLTQLNTPSASLDFLLIWDHTAGVFKKINPTTIAATNTAGVGTIGGLSGTVGVTSGITTTGNSITVDNTVVRKKITAATSIYVNKALGSDSNDCLSPGAGACQTIQHAWDILATKYDVTATTTIQLAAGQTFTESLNAYAYVGTAQVVFDGGTTSVIHPTGAYGIQVAGAFPQRVLIQNTTIQTSTSGNCIQVILGGNVAWGLGNTVGPCADSLIYVDSYGTLEGGAFTIAGSGRSAMRSIQGQISIQLATITITGTPAFSEGFAHVSDLGLIYIPGNTYVGSATGSRFAVDTMGFLFTQASCTALPGDAVGTSTTGGMTDCNYNFSVSGNGLFGSSTITSPGVLLTASNSNTGQIEVHANNSIANNVSYVLFTKNGSTIADIAFNSGTGGVLYNTTSDYRLKENIAGIKHALPLIDQLRPVTYSMIDNPSHEVVQGFLAHELQKVVPWAVTGHRDEVDEKGQPVYQKVDLSKLVPLLAAGVQELTARVERLESHRRAAR